MALLIKNLDTGVTLHGDEAAMDGLVFELQVSAAEARSVASGEGLTVAVSEVRVCGGGGRAAGRGARLRR